MGAGLLVAMTLPGLVLLLVVLAVVERLASRRDRRSPLSRRHRPGLSATAFDAFSAALLPGAAVQQEQQRHEHLLRDDETDREPRDPTTPRRGP